MKYYLFYKDDTDNIKLSYIAKDKEDMEEHIFKEHTENIKVEYMANFCQSFDALHKIKPYRGFVLLAGEIIQPEKVEVVTRYHIPD